MMFILRKFLGNSIAFFLCCTYLLCMFFIVLFFLLLYLDFRIKNRMIYLESFRQATVIVKIPEAALGCFFITIISVADPNQFDSDPDLSGIFCLLGSRSL